MVTKDQYCDEVLPGKVPINKVLETKTVLAFYARQPLWPIHIILIPKQHISSLIELATVDDHVIADIMKSISQVAQKVTKEHGKCRVMTNVGSNQHTKHLHWHIYSEE